MVELRYLFSKRVDTTLHIIQPTLPFEKSYGGALHQVDPRPHSLLSSLQTLIPFPLRLNFCPLSVVSSNSSHVTHVTQVLALDFLINKLQSFIFLLCSIFGCYFRKAMGFLSSIVSIKLF